MVTIILFLIVLNAIYYGYLLHKWNDLTQDGATGQSILGIILTFGSILIIFNLRHILGL